MRIISAVHPTDNQKRVLAKIIAAPTPSVAAEAVAGDANMIAARNLLMKLGLVALSNGELTVTDRGLQVATDENIIDQTGEMTPTGQEMAYTNSAGAADNDQQSAQPTMRAESFRLLKELLS